MKYYLPTQIILGRWEDEIKEVVDSFGAKTLLLITSGQAMRRAGVIDKMLSLFVGYQVSVFDEVEPNPSPETVEKAKISCDLVIGLGGGSTMDMAKVVAFELKKPCIEIPTTAGTGSEVTPFAALYDKQKKKKLSLTPGFPTVALVDYKLTLTLPKEMVAVSGLDALSQAIEAYWCIYSTPLSDVHAKRAIKLVVGNLENSFDAEEQAREAMSLAALEAGLAFSQTKTTAPHSVSYPLTIFYGIPHGLGCALTLPHFLVFNRKVTDRDCADSRGASFVRQKIEQIADFLGEKSVEAAAEKILSLMKSMSMPTEIKFDVELVLDNAFSPERMGNNPRKVTREDLREILGKIKIS